MSAADTATLRLGEFLPYRLSRLANRVSSSLAREYAAGFDLSIPQWRAVAVLGERPGVCADDICEATGMDKVAVSRAIGGLQAAGRVERRPDPGDGRRSRLRLTRAGRAVYRRVAPLALAFEERLLASLGDAERRQLDRLLARLDRRAAELERDPGGGERT